MVQYGSCRPAIPLLDSASGVEPFICPSAGHYQVPTCTALVVTGTQTPRCHPPLLPAQPMEKGRLKQNPPFIRGQACRAPPALVSTGLGILWWGVESATVENTNKVKVKIFQCCLLRPEKVAALFLVTLVSYYLLGKL